MRFAGLGRSRVVGRSSRGLAVRLTVALLVLTLSGIAFAVASSADAPWSGGDSGITASKPWTWNKPATLGDKLDLLGFKRTATPSDSTADGTGSASPQPDVAGPISVASIGVPNAVMAINEGATVTSSTAVSIDSTVTDAVSMSFSPPLVQIDGGDGWAAGVTANGELYRWGTLSSVTPTPVRVGTDSDWQTVSVGYEAVALKTNGTVWTFSKTASPTQKGSGTYKAISAGSGHFLAIDTSNNLYAWGTGTQGQLGYGGTSTFSSPILVSGTGDWAAISAGAWHSVGVKSNGNLYTWGYNTSGQLGDMTTTQRNTPYLVGSGYTTPTAGYEYTMSLCADGTAKAWGSNSNGQLGLGSFGSPYTAPQVIAYGATGWTKLSTGKWHVIAQKSDGTIWSWGYGSNGQKGTGVLSSTATPAQIGTATDWTNIATGYQTSFGYRGGSWYSWGMGSDGCLGDGTTSDRYTPSTSMSVWETYAQHKAYTLSSEQGTQSVSVTYRDAGGSTLLLSDSILVDTQAPTAAVFVNNGRTYTTSRDVSVRVLSVPADVVAMKVGADGEWGAVGEYYDYTLPDSDGWHSVTVYMIDSAGNSGSSGSSVCLDRVAPTGTMTINSGANLTRSTAASMNSSVGPDVAGMLLADREWTTIDGGGGHTMAIDSSGLLYGWGANSSGQIGDGTTSGDGGLIASDRRVPTAVSGGYTWSSVSAGSAHTLGIRSDGTLWAWGSNSNGRLGDATTTQRTTPVQIASPSTWSQVSAGDLHSVGIKSDGTLWGWGYNYYGQVGDGSYTQRTSPVQIGSASDWVQVVTGEYMSFGIRSNGTLWAWGYNYDGRLGLGDTTSRNVPTQVGTDTNWESVTSGGTHVLAVKSNGTLWAWGVNGNGQLGQGDTTARTVPTQVGTDTDWAYTESATGISVAVKDNGSMWSWGTNTNGALGLGIQTSPTVPTEVSKSFTPASLGTYASGTYAIDTAGALWACGYSARIAVADDTSFATLSFIRSGWQTYVTSLPMTIPDVPGTFSAEAWYKDYSGNVVVLSDSILYDPTATGSMELNGGAATTASTNFTLGLDAAWASNMRIGRKWQQVVAGGRTTFVRAQDGPLEMAGNAQFGQRGEGSLPFRYLTWVTATDSRIWKMFDSGGLHQLAIAQDGSLWSWGWGDSGQLGVSGLSYAASPVRVTPGQTYVWCTAGMESSYAIRSDGTLWAWGLNGSGRLGDGTYTSRSVPVQIGTATNWAKVFNWGDHTLGLKTDGSLWAWGANGSGQLGLGDTSVRLTPTLVAAGSQWTTVGAGFQHSLGIKSDGTLWAWGANGSGQLGDGTTTTRTSPKQIGTSTWSTVAAGVYCSLAVNNDGSLWAWGGNTAGELGDGTKTQRTAPVRIGSRNDWENIDSGGLSWVSEANRYFTTGSTTDGAVFVWGYNGFGQIGDGTTTERLSPKEYVWSPLVTYSTSTSFNAPWASGDTTIHACFVDPAGQVSWVYDTIYVTPALPVITDVRPTQDSVVDSSTVEVSARIDVAEGGRPADVEVMVDGEVVASAWDPLVADRIVGTASALADDTTHTVEVRVTDNAGSVVTSTTAFLVESGQKMAHWDAQADCRTCHGVTVPHDTSPMYQGESRCLTCHMGIHGTLPEQPEYRFYNCSCHLNGSVETGWVHHLDPAGCRTCHTAFDTGQDPQPPQTQRHSADTALCKPCHRSELVYEHALRTNDSGQPLTCSTCHQSADAAVQAAIAAGDTACASCHPGADHRTLHQQPALDSPCNSCHDANLLDEHAPRDVVCDTCHESADTTVTNAIAAGDGSCSACHGGAGASHVFTGPAVDKTRCANCHWSTGTVGAELSSVHRHDSAWLGATVVCKTCHPVKSTSSTYVQPMVSSAYGAFLSVDSTTQTAAQLHSIHVRGSSVGAATSDYCKSCHSPAACDACHSGLTHGNHTLDTDTGVYAYAPVSMTVGDGVLPGATDHDTSHTESVACAASGCHAIAGDGSLAAPACVDCHP